MIIFQLYRKSKQCIANFFKIVNKMIVYILFNIFKTEWIGKPFFFLKKKCHSYKNLSRGICVQDVL
jgi:hypothetical protein